VQLEVGEIRRPHERRLAVELAVVDVLAVAAPQRGGLDPAGTVLGARLLVKEAALDSVGVALEGDRASGEVGQ